VKKIIFIGIAILAVSIGSTSFAGSKITEEMFRINNTWMLAATFLVFIMHLGFATLETGLTRAKNSVNILFKNTSIIAIGILTYAMIGFSLMYPGDSWILGHIVGFKGFGLNVPEGSAGLINYADGAYSYLTDFLFQGMFAATAATIVSGAVAERVKLSSFLIFSAVYVAFVYPIIGSWGWGGGWLNSLGFYDFAGSTFVHSVGGWAALIGVIILGPRTGKYVNGKIFPIMGHNMPLATIGVFLLWLGWFGFNGGSVLSADPAALSLVCVTTTLAGAAGLIGAMIMSWSIQKKPDLSMILNGILAGLVGITASANVVSISNSIIIGFIAGIIVVLSVFAFDHLRLDDPVGALSVHLVCGIWGTLAVGIFCTEYSFLIQLYGVVIIGITCMTSSLVIFYVLKILLGIRVSKLEELRGLDIGEHGMEAYDGFQIFTNQ